MIWKYINSGFRTGAFNMMFDEQLARQFDQRERQPILRIYGWSPPTISIGFNQNIKVFDISKLSTQGIDIVRRPTGGRAIFHAHELTYSIVMATDDQSPRAIYRYINRGLLRGLQLLGIHAELSSRDTDFRKHYQDESSIPCFSSSAKNEIQFEGKKLVGSAQRRFGNVILQHGSFLLGTEHRKIVDFLADHVNDLRGIIEGTISSRTIEAETILGRPITLDEAAAAIKCGFENEYQIEFEESNDIEYINNHDKLSISI